VIGECLHNVSRIGGKVVSVTTDGFITNIPDLETKLLGLRDQDIPLLKLYKDLRRDITDCETPALELKHSGKGIISWSTRGQLGIGSSIKATTGFQSFGYTKEELVSQFKEVLSSQEKEFEYTQSRLRGAKDVFKSGGHVTLNLRDQTVRLHYDNRRSIVEPKDFTGYDMSNNLFDSKPLESILVCSKLRFLSKLAFKIPYLKSSPTRGSSKTAYKTFLEVGIRNFIKGYFSLLPCFGLKGTEFKRYQDLIDFIYGFYQAKDVKLSKQSISQLKRRRLILRPVPKTKENLEFVEYVVSKLPYFDKTLFLKY
jgi:hypothetical protein